MSLWSLPRLVLIEKGGAYPKKTGKHEFIQRQHLSEAFLRSIGQVDGFSPDLNGMTWVDVYKDLQVDTSSLVFYQLDGNGKSQVVDVLYRNDEDPIILSEEESIRYKQEGARVYSEVLITGGGHEGSIYVRTDEETRAARTEKGRLNPGVKQSTAGSKPFHRDLEEAFYNPSNSDPGKLVFGLF